MNASGTLEAPGRAGAHPVVRQVGQVALVLAILISTTIALATRYESGVSVGGATRATRVSHIDARWTPKWQFAAGLAMANQTPVLDARWVAKMAWVANKIARDEATAPSPNQTTVLDASWVAAKMAREAAAETQARP